MWEAEVERGAGGSRDPDPAAVLAAFLAHWPVSPETFPAAPGLWGMEQAAPSGKEKQPPAGPSLLPFLVEKDAGSGGTKTTQIHPRKAPECRAATPTPPMCGRGLGGTGSPALGLKYELRGCEWDKGVGTPSPQLCTHIWQAQPSPHTPCPAPPQLPADAGSHRQPLAPKPCLRRSEGRGLWAGFAPFLCRGQSLPRWQQRGSATAPSACPLPPCREQGHQARALVATTAKPGLVLTRREPSLSSPWCGKPGSFASLEDGGRSLLPQKPPTSTLKPS